MMSRRKQTCPRAVKSPEPDDEQLERQQQEDNQDHGNEEQQQQTTTETTPENQADNSSNGASSIVQNQESQGNPDHTDAISGGPTETGTPPPDQTQTGTEPETDGKAEEQNEEEDEQEADVKINEDFDMSNSNQRNFRSVDDDDDDAVEETPTPQPNYNQWFMDQDEASGMSQGFIDTEQPQSGEQSPSDLVDPFQFSSSSSDVTNGTPRSKGPARGMYHHQGYNYTYAGICRSDQTIQFWRCQKKNAPLKCNGRVHTRNGQVLAVVTAHNHEPTEEEQGTGWRPAAPVFRASPAPKRTKLEQSESNASISNEYQENVHVKTETESQSMLESLLVNENVDDSNEQEGNQLNVDDDENSQSLPLECSNDLIDETGSTSEPGSMEGTPKGSETDTPTKNTCSFCQARFQTRNELLEHEQEHAHLMPFRCRYCGKGFKHKRSLDRHEVLHSGQKQYQCIYCESAFFRSDHLKVHMRTHLSQRDRANLAGANTTESMVPALYAADRAESKVYEKNFTDHLKLHMRTHLSQRDRVSTGGTNTATESMSRTDQAELYSADQPANSGSSMFSGSDFDAQHYCDACGEVFGDKQQLKQHWLVTHQSGAGQLDRSSLIQQARFNETSLACSLCGEMFGNVAALQTHTLTKHVKGNMEKSNYSAQATLASEHHQQHKYDKRYPCAHCSRTFDGLLKLHEHTKREHPNADNSARANDADMPYQCTICQGRFGELPTFIEHMERHDKEEKAKTLRTSVCDLCCDRFATKDELYQHVMSAHFVHNTHSYVCELCRDAKFANVLQLQTHLLASHAVVMFKCGVCSMVKPTEDALKTHFLQRHCPERNEFRCAKCTLVFSTIDKIEQHVINVHVPSLANVATFGLQLRCPSCGRVFTTQQQLERHTVVCPCGPNANARGKSFTSTLGSRPASTFTESLRPGPPPLSIRRYKAEQSSLGLSPVIEPVRSTQQHQLSKQRATGSWIPPPVMKHRPEPPTAVSRADHHELAMPSDQLLTMSVVTDSLFAMPNKRGAARIMSGAPCGGIANAVGSSWKKCNICDARFQNVDQLGQHKLTHCKVGRCDQCHFCQQQLTGLEQFAHHMQMHNQTSHGTAIVCVICRQTLIAPVELETHARFHLFSDGNPTMVGETGGGAGGGGQPTTSSASPFHLLPISIKQEADTTTNFKELSGANNADDVTCALCSQRFMDRAQLYEHQLSSACISELAGVSDAKLTAAEPAPSSSSSSSTVLPFQCIKCQKTFATEAAIQAHVATHVLQEGVENRCYLCDSSFASPAKLQAHLIDHSFAGCAAFKCYLCNTTFSLAPLLQHHMTEHNPNQRPYDCTQCELKFFFRSELDNHVAWHQDREQQQKFRSMLRANQQLHGFMGSNSDLHRLSDSVSEFVQRDVSEVNETSDRPLSSAGGALQHAIGGADVIVEERPSSTPLNTNDDDHNTHKQQPSTSGGSTHETSVPVSPSASSAVPDWTQLLIASDATNNDVNTISIGGDNTSAIDKPLWSAKEMQSVQPNMDGQYQCPHCTKAFCSLAALQGHSHVHMMVTRNHKCDECGKAFATMAKLRHHQKNHLFARVKPFECEICGKEFSRKDNLKVHMRSHYRHANQTAELLAASAGLVKRETPLPTMVHNVKHQ